jgi:hypothetical protein
LSSQFIVNADDCSFCDGVVLDQSRFNFGGRETVARDVDDIVDTTSDPVVSFVITSSSIPGELSELVAVSYTKKVIQLT